MAQPFVNTKFFLIFNLRTSFLLIKEAGGQTSSTSPFKSYKITLPAPYLLHPAAPVMRHPRCNQDPQGTSLRSCITYILINCRTDFNYRNLANIVHSDRIEHIVWIVDEELIVLVLIICRANVSFVQQAVLHTSNPSVSQIFCSPTSDILAQQREFCCKLFCLRLLCNNCTCSTDTY